MHERFGRKINGTFSTVKGFGFDSFLLHFSLAEVLNHGLQILLIADERNHGFEILSSLDHFWQELKVGIMKVRQPSQEKRAFSSTNPKGLALDVVAVVGQKDAEFWEKLE